jgi:hypothetical protein
MDTLYLYEALPPRSKRHSAIAIHPKMNSGKEFPSTYAALRRDKSARFPCTFGLQIWSARTCPCFQKRRHVAALQINKSVPASATAFEFNKEHLKSGKISSLFPAFLIQQTSTSIAALRMVQHTSSSSLPG